MGGQSLRVHQMVHGYRAGHQLLQMSRAVPTEVQRAMLVQSDLSGPSLVPGFEQYLTGYPLDEIGAYVLARTWYAPEMDRPGCVWTHSLLIDYPDLARFDELSSLVGYFRRPTLDVVGKPSLPTLSVTGEVHPLSARDLSLAIRISGALYGAPESSVVLFRRDAAELEPIVLWIWSQQWPRLRRSFRFCTGALSTRVHQTVAFDLAVAPTALRGAVRRDAPSALVPDEVESSADAEWLRIAELGMTLGGASFREFLWSYGADVVHPRRAWRGLVEAFRWTHPEAAAAMPLAAEVVERLAERFPTREDGRRLKIDLLGDSGERLFATKDVLSALATSTASEAFDAEAIGVQRRARELWQHDRDAASSLLRELIDGPLNPLGAEMLSALCDAVGPAVAIELERMHRGVLPLLVARSPQLARSPALWRGSRDAQRELVEVLSQAGTDALRGAIGAMIEAGANDVGLDVARILGDAAVSAILQALSQSDAAMHGMIGDRWRQVLSQSPSEVIDWVQETSATPARLALAVSVLDPLDETVRRVPVRVWLRIASGTLDTLRDETRTRASAFLLSIAFASTELEASALSTMTFDNVYAAARRSWISSSVWRWLEPQLPHARYYRNWDWCERLSLGLFERFQRHGWPLQEFLSAARDSEALEQALGMSERLAGGSDFVALLRAAAAHGDVRVTVAQQRVLRKWE